MAFWLCSKREGQDSDWIQRFDPRFWTVDFPRPMMAAVMETSRPRLRLPGEQKKAVFSMGNAPDKVPV